MTPDSPLSLAAEEWITDLTTAEMERLRKRTTLTLAEEQEVCRSVRSIAQQMMLAPVSMWQGDPRLVADLFDLPVTVNQTQEGRPCRS
ncbi:hypothetical protein ACFVWF_15045 [Rhodococcus qingshengii]|uniref:hypothetical protein n=1 Tax=Rhodococcus qingshengii TaxID=334542 RepID=UPI0001A2165A|nr:hypothetical protein RHOER0001_1817 [Rhodococcus erythropolis SK121]